MIKGFKVRGEDEKLANRSRKGDSSRYRKSKKSAGRVPCQRYTRVSLSSKKGEKSKKGDPTRDRTRTTEADKSRHTKEISEFFSKAKGSKPKERLVIP